MGVFTVESRHALNNGLKLDSGRNDEPPARSSKWLGQLYATKLQYNLTKRFIQPSIGDTRSVALTLIE